MGLPGRLQQIRVTQAVVLTGLGLLIAGTAAFAAVFFHDRTALATMTARWALIWAVATGALSGWLWWDVRSSNDARPWTIAARWLPLAIPTALVVLVYSSDTLHHFLLSWNRARIVCGALALSALVLIWMAQRASRQVAEARRDAWLASLAVAAPLVLGASLLAQGVLQAASYTHLAVDDFGRYWAIADSLAAGNGYPVWEAKAGTAQGGGSGYWTDLPVLPVLLIASFALFGHTLTAAHVPLLLANLALPFVLFALYRQLTGDRLWAFAGAALILFLPFLQIYTLGASEPDPILVVLVSALLWRVVVLARTGAAMDSRGLRRQGLALGLLAAATALVRPEGLVYVALVPAGLVLQQGSRRALWWALVPAAVPIVGFAAAMWPSVERPWPQVPRELDLANIPTNLRIAEKPLAHAAQHLHLSETLLLVLTVLLTAVAVLGAASLVRAHRALVGWPIALLAHGALLLLLDPFSLRTGDPTEFLRHISYAWPLLLGLMLPICSKLRGVPGAMSIAGAALLASAFAYLTATAEEVCAFGYLSATPEAGCASLGRGSLLRSDIYLLWTDLLRVRYELPKGLDETTFHVFRDDLFATYQPYDLHGTDYGFDYQLASWLAFIAALPFVAARTIRERASQSHHQAHALGEIREAG